MNSQADARPGLDAVAGRVTADLIRLYHLMPPGALAATLAEAARPLGVTGAQVYLADLQQRQLVPLDSQGPGVLPIDSTLAGRAFQTVTIQPVRAAGASQLWIPLVDGTERLGVLP
jgi:hypothetical protein